MKTHIREGSDEIEQYAEPDRVGREQSRVAQMRDHLLTEASEPAERTKWRSRGSTMVTMIAPASVSSATGPERCAPAEQIGHRAGERNGRRNRRAREPEINNPVMRATPPAAIRRRYRPPPR